MLLHRPDWEEHYSTRSIWRNARSGACNTALAELNKRAQAEDPKVLLLAGDLSEMGPCIARDWQKAAVYYEVALEKNEHAALPRLVQIHARDGRDPVTAMRWAHHRLEMVPKACRAQAAASQPQAFADEVRTWPQQRLSACTQHAYVTFNLWDRLSYINVGGLGEMVPVEATLNLADNIIRWSDVGKDKVFEIHPNMQKRPDDALQESLYSLGWLALQNFRTLGLNGEDWTVKFTIQALRPLPRVPRTLFIDVAN